MNQSSTDIDENDFDSLPSLFPSEVSNGVTIFTVKSWQKLKLVMKRVGKELRSKSTVIVRGANDEIESCISCVEMAKKWLSEKPIICDSDCTNIYQWNKIGQIKFKTENKIEIDNYIPIMEILLSLQPFSEHLLNDSMQESKAIEISPSIYKLENSSFAFGPFEQKKIEPIGNENPKNVFRKKRKR